MTTQEEGSGAELLEQTEGTDRTVGADGTEGEGAEGDGTECTDGTDGETALEKKRRKMREAQRRYYDKHKRKKDPTNPRPSYCPERIQAAKHEYYTQHRDEIIARSKRRYQAQKEQKAALERATGAKDAPPLEVQPTS